MKVGRSLLGLGMANAATLITNSGGNGVELGKEASIDSPAGEFRWVRVAKSRFGITADEGPVVL